MGSPSFATRWARHDVRFHVTSTKRLRSSLVGEIALTGDALDLAGDGLTLIAYTAEPEAAPKNNSTFSSAGYQPPRDRGA
jgi:hypothetical protein